ncbi:pullulanase [Klebsiella michiganensis]|uniref:Pullulanase n=1 Tax=Klebsiella michiganensis TaxID=1134687 RepID=A0A7H4N7A9_9ENTR|nr:pullulanase [Klebsiella michiganensis]
MTVDDGVKAGASLDSRLDGLVVMINAAPESRTLNEFAGETLQLSAIPAGSGRKFAGKRRADCR